MMSLLRTSGKLLPNRREQREREAVDADVIVFVKTARFLYCPRFALPVAELFDANEVGIFTPHRAFPFALLLEMVLPGDFGVVRRIVAAVTYVFRHRIVDVFDQPSIDRDAANGR